MSIVKIHPLRNDILLFLKTQNFGTQKYLGKTILASLAGKDRDSWTSKARSQLSSNLGPFNLHHNTTCPKAGYNLLIFVFICLYLTFCVLMLMIKKRREEGPVASQRSRNFRF